VQKENVKQAWKEGKAWKGDNLLVQSDTEEKLQ
jgi:hypothetical protein